MKQAIFLIAIIGLTLFSCKKSDSIDPISTPLDGKWRMIIIKENVSGLTITKPSTIQGDVDITFSSTSSTNGTFMGNTPTNEIWQNDFSIGANQSFTIPCLAMTKVMETSWEMNLLTTFVILKNIVLKLAADLILRQQIKYSPSENCNAERTTGGLQQVGPDVITMIGGSLLSGSVGQDITIEQSIEQ